MKLNLLLGSVIATMLVGCSTEGAHEFHDASERYLSCAMDAPWPLDLVGDLGVDGATFQTIANNPFDVESVIFTRYDQPSWELDVFRKSEDLEIRVQDDLVIATFRHVVEGLRSSLERPVAILRRDNFELHLFGDTSRALNQLVDQCIRSS